MSAGRSSGARARDVRALLEAARRVARRAEADAPAIAAATGLSREGVLLALREHLEVGATPTELAALVARARPPQLQRTEAPRVHVILSANVFTAALRALAIARAASRDVTVRPSRRDPWLARALVAELGSPEVRLAEELAPESLEAGEIHVYGRDETIEAVRGAARPGVRVVGHGAGMGLAWIGPQDGLAAAAEALARDIVPFDQRGCLSPRVAIVAGGATRASVFAEELGMRLAAWEARVPSGALTDDEAEARARWLETMTLAGEVMTGPAHAIAVAAPESPLVVPPPGRHLHVAPARDVAAALAVVIPLVPALVAVGSNDPAARLFSPRHARLSRLGLMQRPPLDGPVDGRSEER